MTLHLASIAAAIAALNITGVKIYDTDEIPVEGTVRSVGMFPLPDHSFVSGFTTERNTFGTAAAALKHAEYDLNYLLIVVPSGAGRAGYLDYSDLIDKATAVIEAVLNNDTLGGAGDISPQDTDYGPQAVPSGTSYLGCKLVFHVLDYL